MLPPEILEELNIQSDRNIFEMWTDEIVDLYVNYGPFVPNCIFRRCLWNSGLVKGTKDRPHSKGGPSGHRYWTDEGIAMIVAELDRRGIKVERHHNMYKHHGMKEDAEG